MMIIDAIRRAGSRETVYLLLSAYLETLQFSRKLPEPLTALPVTGTRDVWSRSESIIAEFEKRRGLSDPPTNDAIVVEAICVFDAAIYRLSQLPGELLCFS